MSGTAFKVPRSVAKLGPDVVAEIEGLVHGAERREEKEGAEAAESSLRIVPRPLRPLIRKVLGM